MLERDNRRGTSVSTMCIITLSLKFSTGNFTVAVPSEVVAPTPNLQRAMSDLSMHSAIPMCLQYARYCSMLLLLACAHPVSIIST